MRLTTNKPTEEMNMYELAHNSCYVENRLARYRDFDRDIDARDFARELMVSYGLWKSCKEYGLDADNELVDDEIFDDTMLDNMQYDATTIEGLLALFYRNLWAMADLHSKLKHYEDLEEQGGLLETPCMVGDVVYAYSEEFFRILEYHVETINIGYDTDNPKGYWSFEAMCSTSTDLLDDIDFTTEDIGKTVFLTEAEAEAKLAELKGGAE